MIQKLNILREITVRFRGSILFMIAVLIISCGGNDDSGGEEPISNDPTAATLIFPEENSECTEGSNKTTTQSTIQFKWSPGLNTNKYKLDLKDLNTGVVTSYSSSNTNMSIKVQRANPYSWSVVSTSNSSTKTAKSPIWKFFNAGEGIVSYAPFPAEVVTPLLGSIVDASVVSLDWSGSDVDGDIKSYDVYFGETENPVMIQEGITDSLLNDISVESGKKYYWKIDTKDEAGNISISDVFYFSVN